jgi:uncharacterized membrane protein YphA (DoxX/SURF4 family)
VAWGDFAAFTAYAGKLNWFAPPALFPVLAWAATVAEAALTAALLFGFYTRAAAALSGALLLAFALTMTAALGPKAPLDFSVWTAVGGALLLALSPSYALSVDALLARRRRDVRASGGANFSVEG